jgi:predicted N-acetyltransferase YhbS
MELCFYPEEPKDYRAVEEITREAFWNLHVPGCDEHLLAHNLRGCAAFVPELDFVAEAGGEIAGNIMYCRAKVAEDNGCERDVLTFGPVSVMPRLQKRGIGAALIRHSLKAAAGMGFTAVLIYGDPGYYCRFGFKPAEVFGIRTSEGRFHPALQALELAPGALCGAAGRFFEGEAYHVDPAELEAFDSTFPPKEKLVTESQRRFAALAGEAQPEL